MALFGLSVFAQLWPTVFELDCARVVEGEWWRLLTGNLVHCGWSHQLADMGAFVVLSWVVWRRTGHWGVVTLVSAAAVGVAAFVWGGVATYRGMSGVNYALLVAAVGSMAVGERGKGRVLWLAVLAGVALKVGVEAMAGELTVNVCLPEGVVLVGQAHVAGVCVGVCSTLAGAYRPVCNCRSRATDGKAILAETG
ncbi:rhombosortase [bacterium]|nr:rhombosortase [bacterium]